MTLDEARQFLHQSEACLSSKRVFDHWANHKVDPELCLELAKASFTDNDRYNQLKESLDVKR